MCYNALERGVVVKIVSARVRNLYMRVFLDAADRSGSNVVKAGNPALFKLRQRGDFVCVVPVLEGLGLISASRADNGQIYKFTILPEGMAYFEKRADEKWKFWRNSVIVPIVVSFVTALISGMLIPPTKDWLVSLLQSFLKSLQ